MKAPSMFAVRNVGKTLVTRTQGTKVCLICSQAALHRLVSRLRRIRPRAPLLLPTARRPTARRLPPTASRAASLRFHLLTCRRCGRGLVASCKDAAAARSSGSRDGGGPLPPHAAACQFSVLYKCLEHMLCS